MFRIFQCFIIWKYNWIITVFRIEEFSSFLIRDGIGDIVEVHLSNVLSLIHIFDAEQMEKVYEYLEANHIDFLHINIVFICQNNICLLYTSRCV